MYYEEINYHLKKYYTLSAKLFYKSLLIYF